jgi:hypothetical protein
MAEATQSAKKSPNGRAKLPAGPVGERVAALRKLAKTDGAGAREEAWSWIEELGHKAREQREEAHKELQELFLCGEPADDVAGQTEGILVTTTTHPLADKVLGAITDAWMPWLGKRFMPEEQAGVNTLTGGARVPLKVIWPLYSTRESPLGRSAFDFKTYVEAGKLDPSVDVLVIDYESVPSNPMLLIRQIRDELVRIVPGANLGKMLVSVPDVKALALPPKVSTTLFPALYFALKSDI